MFKRLLKARWLRHINWARVWPKPRENSEPSNVRGPDDQTLFPSVFVLDNHRACNAACRMCPTQQEKIVGGCMPDEVFAAFLAQIEPHVTEIQEILFGVHGEPLLDKDLENRIAALTTLGVKNVSINTNGSALVRERAARLIAAKTAHITLAMDGHTAATYEAVRIGLNFENVVRNIEQCISLRDQSKSSMRITLRLIMQTTNKHQIDDWSRHWKSRLDVALDDVQVVPIHNWAYRQTTEAGFGTTACSSVFSAMVIAHDGSIPLCCLDHEPRYKLGNILVSEIATIFNNDEFKGIRRLHSNMQRNAMSLCSTCDRPETRSLVTADDEFLRERERAFIWTRPSPE